MLAFWDGNKALTVRKSGNRGFLTEQSVVIIEQSLSHYYSNIAVTQKWNTLIQQLIEGETLVLWSII